MERLSLRTLFIYTLILVFFFNIIKGVSMGADLFYYLTAAGAPAVCLCFLFIFDSAYVEIGSLVFMGVVATIFSLEPGNLTGAIFFVFSAMLVAKRNFCIYIYFFTLFSTVCKYMFIEQPITRGLNDLVGYTFVYLTAYIIYKRLSNEQNR